MRLSSNQYTVLQGVVDGKLYGYMHNRTIPSLVKRGLLVSVKVEPVGPQQDIFPNIPQTVYRFTPAGLAAYTSNRQKLHASRVAREETSLGRDLVSARGKTMMPETP